MTPAAVLVRECQTDSTNQRPSSRPPFWLRILLSRRGTIYIKRTLPSTRFSPRRRPSHVCTDDPHDVRFYGEKTVSRFRNTRGGPDRAKWKRFGNTVCVLLRKPFGWNKIEDESGVITTTEWSLCANTVSEGRGSTDSSDIGMVPIYRVGEKRISLNIYRSR